MVGERDDGFAIKKQSFARVTVGNVGKLMGRYAQLLCQNLPVALGLVKHIDEVTVFKVILSRCFVQFCKKIMQGLDLPC